MSLTLAQAQKSLSSKDMIAITPVVCDGMDLNESVKKMLNMKLMQIVTANGFGSTSPRYALVPNLVIVDKQVTPTAPPMFSIDFELSLYVLDVAEGVIIGETSLPLKGVDRMEAKVYVSALSQINARNPQLSVFMEKCRKSILDYYATRTMTILQKANSLAERGLYDDAIAALAPIPETVDEYAVVAETMVAIYKKRLDKDAQRYMQQAEKCMIEENMGGAIEALMKIDPSSNYWVKANEEIAKYKKELTSAARNAKLEAEKAQLEARIAKAEAERRALESQAKSQAESQDISPIIEEAKSSVMEEDSSAFATFAKSVNSWFVGMFK